MNHPILILSLLLVGCSTLPKVRLGRDEAVAPKDPGTPAVVEHATQTVSVPLPESSSILLEPFSVDGVNTAQKMTISLSAPTEMRVVSSGERASTGTVDPTVAQARFESQRGMARDRTKLIIAAGMIVAGLGAAFALPKAFRWPQAGLYVAGAGLVLAIIPEPPLWAVAALLGASAAVVVAYYSLKAKPEPEAT